MSAKRMKHVEMIVDYVVVGEDFQYSDNHGILTRCRDCKHYRKTRKECGKTYKREPVKDDFFCAGAERKGNKN